MLMYDFPFTFVAKEFNEALCCIIPTSFASAHSKSKMDYCLIQDLIHPTFRRYNNLPRRETLSSYKSKIEVK